MRYPEFLKTGDTISFAAPSFGCVIEPYHSAFLNALSQFEKRGFLISLGENCFKDDGCGISSLPESCAREINQAFLSDSKAVLSCGGGELMCEILDGVDFEAIKRAKPKWFMGYSDNTNLTFLLNTLADTASIYGPCAPAFGMEPWHKSIEDAYRLITGGGLSFSGYDFWQLKAKKDELHPLLPYNTTEKNRYVLYNGDKAADRLSVSGRLLGGCLDCLNILAGTRFDRVSDFIMRYKNDGILWFLEACELNTFDIRRTLWHLKECGWFENAKGFLVGRPERFGESIMGLDQYDAVLSVLSELNVPIIMDLDIGHLPPQLPIVSGALGTVKATENNWTIEYVLE